MLSVFSISNFRIFRKFSLRVELGGVSWLWMEEGLRMTGERRVACSGESWSFLSIFVRASLMNASPMGYTGFVIF